MFLYSSHAILSTFHLPYIPPSQHLVLLVGCGRKAHDADKWLGAMGSRVRHSAAVSCPEAACNSLQLCSFSNPRWIEPTQGTEYRAETCLGIGCLGNLSRRPGSRSSRRNFPPRGLWPCLGATPRKSLYCMVEEGCSFSPGLCICRTISLSSC